MSFISLPGMVQKELARWEDCEGLPEMTLLRLALLRELSQKLHSEKSKYLSLGKKEEVKAIKEWESRLQVLRESACLSGPLLPLLESSSMISKKKRFLPDALLKRIGYQIGHENAHEFGHELRPGGLLPWETAIASEAVQLGWAFWRLDAWIEIGVIDEWNSFINEALWPHGFMLLMQEGRAGHVTSRALTEKDPWLGHWTILLHPHFNGPRDLSLNLDRWAAKSLSSQPIPLWKQLYPY